MFSIIMLYIVYRTTAVLKVDYYAIYRIMVITKVDTDPIDSISAGPIWRDVILVIIYVEIYKTGVGQVSRPTNLFETDSQLKLEENLKETLDAPLHNLHRNKYIYILPTYCYKFVITSRWKKCKRSVFWGV